MDPLKTIEPGRVLGGAYRIERALGAGGVGAVYVATQLRTGRRYALKVLLPDIAMRDGAAQRFKREAETLAALGHTGIVQIHDFDTEPDGTQFLVMDLLDGEDLATRLAREGALDLPVALRILDEVGAALGAAHARGVVHRDLKPANVFLAQRPGSPERATILDFGLAKSLADDARLTATGVGVGTPLYMAPEQARGDELDLRTDVYALGCILFEMLAGSAPFNGPTISVVLAKILTEDPPHLSQVAKRPTPIALDAVVRRALAKSPRERFATAEDLVASARRAAGDSSERALAATAVAATPLPATREARLGELAISTLRPPAPSAATTGAPVDATGAAVALPSGLTTPRSTGTASKIGVGLLGLALGAGLVALGAMRPWEHSTSAEASSTAATTSAASTTTSEGRATSAETTPLPQPTSPPPAITPPLDPVPRQPHAAEAGGERAIANARHTAPAPTTTSTATTSTATPATPPPAAPPASPSAAMVEELRTAAPRAIASYQAQMAQNDERIATLEQGLATLVDVRQATPAIRRGDFAICTSALRTTLGAQARGSEPGVASGAAGLLRQVDAMCDEFETWTLPDPSAMARFDGLAARFDAAIRALEHPVRALDATDSAEALRILQAARALHAAQPASYARYPCGDRAMRALETEFGDDSVAREVHDVQRVVESACRNVGASPGRLQERARQLDSLVDIDERQYRQLIQMLRDMNSTLRTSIDHVRAVTP